MNSICSNPNNSYPSFCLPWFFTWSLPTYAETRPPFPVQYRPDDYPICLPSHDWSAPYHSFMQLPTSLFQLSSLPSSPSATNATVLTYCSLTAAVLGDTASATLLSVSVPSQGTCIYPQTYRSHPRTKKLIPSVPSARLINKSLDCLRGFSVCGGLCESSDEDPPSLLFT